MTITKDPTQSKLSTISKAITAIQKDMKSLEKSMEDVKEIKRVLKGDTYGTKGLVQSHKDLKGDFNMVREDVKKAKIIGGVITTIMGVLIAFFRR